MVFHREGDFEEASKKVEVLHRIHEYLYTVSIEKVNERPEETPLEDMVVVLWVNVRFGVVYITDFIDITATMG